MSKLPVVSPREVVSALLKAGYSKHRQVGSHLTLKNESTGRRVVVPMHAKDLPPGTLKAILRQTDMSNDEFIEYL